MASTNAIHPASLLLSPAVSIPYVLSSSSSWHVLQCSSSVVPILATESVSIVPTHPMTTRGNDDIFKPKTFSSIAIDPAVSISLHLIEPTTVKSAWCIPEWMTAMILNIKSSAQSYSL
ncbi:hypothetical protein ACOSQ3_004121 [Xanthoceras sorbifolium]